MIPMTNDVSNFSISHLKVLKKFQVVWCVRVIIMSALSLSFRDKEIERERKRVTEKA